MRIRGFSFIKYLAERHYDVVHIEHIRAAYLARWIGDVPSVYDFVDRISLGFGACGRMLL